MFFLENCKDDETLHFTMPGEHVLDFAAAIIVGWFDAGLGLSHILDPLNLHQYIYVYPYVLNQTAITWRKPHFETPLGILGKSTCSFWWPAKSAGPLYKDPRHWRALSTPIAFQQEWVIKSNHMANMAYTPQNSHSNGRNDETLCWFCT